MRYSPLRHILGGVAAFGILAAALLLGGSRTATADGDEEPADVFAYPNSPGMITVAWTHSGEDVYYFVLEQESPYAFATPDRDKRVWSVPNLEPNRTYRFRVCAVYDFNRVCSDWVSVTTPAAGSGGSSGSGGSPSGSSSTGVRLPAAVAMPTLRAKVVSPAQIDLAWDLPPAGSVVLTHGKLYRDGTFIYEALQQGNYDGDYTDVNRRQGTTYRYKFCFEGPAFGERCSSEVTVRTPLVIAEPYTPGAGTQVSSVISAPASPGAKPYTPGASTMVRGVPTPLPVAGPYRPGVGTTRSQP